MDSPRRFTKTTEAVEYLLKNTPEEIRIATPLGLGKPNRLLNDLYDQIKNHSSRVLRLYTALSLEPPQGSSFLEKRFLEPFTNRHFGKDYPHLHYVQDLKAGQQPPRVHIHEFYFQAGQDLHLSRAQQDYSSVNYTHVAAYLLQNEIQIVVQLVAQRQHQGKTQYSLSCNPDVTLDLKDLYQKNGMKLLILAVVHPDLPFMGGDAEVSEDYFDAILETPESSHTLFTLPRMPVGLAEHWIGFHASQLVADGGTLQIGIGSLSDALVHSMIQRQKNPSQYQALVKKYYQGRPRTHEVHDQVFHDGLYGTSEMVMDGFMHLRRHGILRREIFERQESVRRYLHGAFFLGSKDFYQWLRGLQGDDFSGLNMTRVSLVNDLYDAHELALRRQRKKARFFNTCMNVSLLGGAASETLENGQVISGIGGQYNFVAMAHELPDAYSVLMLRSARRSGRRRHSNIIWSQGHLSIPRHLRDVIVTEYGVAFLKGKTDAEVIQALLTVTDSEFQEELLETAKSNGKLAADWKIPDWACNNTPSSLQDFVHEAQATEFFPPFPFGSDFTTEEEKLLLALQRLQAAVPFPSRLFHLLAQGCRRSAGAYEAELERMKLRKVSSPSEWLFQKLLLGSF